jgi:hypothetical protein
MTQDELVKDIQQEISFSNSHPVWLPEREIRRQINIAAEFFYDNWRHAIEPRYLVLPKQIFKDETFKKYRQIKLPDCIRFVYQLEEIRGGNLFGTIDKDFTRQKFIGSEIFLTPFMGESLMYRSIAFSFLDLTEGFILSTVAYDYNKNSNLLTITGRDPGLNVIAKCSKTIEPEYLYEDELFQRYARAKCKYRTGRLMKIYDFKLPGGIELNESVLINEAKEEIQEIKDQIWGENTPDFMIFSHNVT